MIDPALLDDIYATAAVPDAWPDLLERLVRLNEARCACMFAVSQWNSSHYYSRDNDGFFDRYIQGGWMEPNDRGAPMLERHAPCFLTDTDLHPRDAIPTMPVYRDLLIPEGYATAAGTVIQAMSDRMVILTLEGFSSEAHVRAMLPGLDRLRPHLARAASLSAQIGRERAGLMVDALDLMGTPAAVIAGNGYMRAANRRFETVIGDRATTVHRRLLFRRMEVNRWVDGVIAKARGGIIASGSIALRASDSSAACVIHMLPLRRTACDMFDSDGFVLIVADPDNRLVPKAGLLRLLFDLTPAEAMLTVELATGRSLQAAAGSRGIAYATARVHLRSIFAKTGCSRQAELVALLHVPGMAVDADPH